MLFLLQNNNLNNSKTTLPHKVTIKSPPKMPSSVSLPLPRSAPSTPQGDRLPPYSLGNPSGSVITSPFIVPVSKSPSHNTTTKHQRIPILKPQLSAPSDLAGPSSPTDTNKSSRQKKFHRHFKNVGDNEKVLNYYSCALVADILLQGRLYITNNYFAFYSNVFGYVTKLLIPTVSVLKISKEKTARIIPNAIGIATEDDKHVFGSLLSRDSTYRFMLQVWKAAMGPPSIPPSLIKREMEDSGGASGDQQIEEAGEDTSETGSDIGLDLQTTADTQTDQSFSESIRLTKLSNGKFSTTIQTSNKEINEYLTKSAVKVEGSSSRLLVSASLVLLIALSVSAFILVLRIGQVEQYLGVKDPPLSDTSSSKTQEFLTAHIVALAKVRESLAALSFMVNQEFEKFLINKEKETMK